MPSIEVSRQDEICFPSRSAGAHGIIYLYNNLGLPGIIQSRISVRPQKATKRRRLPTHYTWKPVQFHTTTTSYESYLQKLASLATMANASTVGRNREATEKIRPLATYMPHTDARRVIWGRKVRTKKNNKKIRLEHIKLNLWIAKKEYWRDINLSHKVHTLNQNFCPNTNQP